MVMSSLSLSCVTTVPSKSRKTPNDDGWVRARLDLLKLRVDSREVLLYNGVPDRLDEDVDEGTTGERTLGHEMERRAKRERRL